jgi:hypothetical protein
MLAIAGVLAGAALASADAAAFGVKAEGREATAGDNAALGAGVGTIATDAGVGVAWTAGGLGNGNVDEICD